MCSQSPFDVLHDALEILELPVFVSREEIKKQYRFLSQKYHPDKGGNAAEMGQINHAYTLLMKYIEEFRYTFDEEEIRRQFPGESHGDRFRP